MADHDREGLLNILETQGRQFLNSFSLLNSFQTKQKRTDDDGKGKGKVSKVTQDEESEEWLGFGKDIFVCSGSEDGGGEDDGFKQDDFSADVSTRAPDVVVFSDPRTKSTASVITTKAQKRAFMSSRVSKLTQIMEDNSRPDEQAEDADDEHTNIQNDVLLHQLVHTKLLSGSLNSELELTPAQRKKALAGRLLEMSAGVKLGQGEKVVREAERNKAAKRVREGLLDKKRERGKKELEEAKNMGNYHPALKKLYETSSTSTGSSNRKRDRGLKMGVGRFSGGMLKLNKEEIHAAQSSRTRGRGGSRGRGRGRRGARGRGTT